MKIIVLNEMSIQLIFTIKMGQLLVTDIVWVVDKASCQSICISDGTSTSTATVTGMELNVMWFSRSNQARISGWHSKQITSLQSYQACIEHIFADQVYNFWWVEVWFHVRKLV